MSLPQKVFQFCRKQHLTEFINNNNHFRFKKCFDIASTADEHITLYLNYHSVGYLTMYYFGRCLSFKQFKIKELLNLNPLFCQIYFLEVSLRYYNKYLNSEVSHLHVFMVL